MPFPSGTRKTKRRKMVLTVVVIRRDGQEKHLAHTIDLTDSSARVGGLKVLLEPGETVEIKRNTLKAKFQVIWMGAPNTAMEGQAGLHSLEPDRSIWGSDMPQDEADVETAKDERRDAQLVRTIEQAAGDKRWHARYQCEGSATVRTVEGSQATHGTLKDISAGGIYVETLVPLPVDTVVDVKMSVLDMWIDARGVVRTHHPGVGMGIRISFQKLTKDNTEKLTKVLHSLKHGLRHTNQAYYQLQQEEEKPQSKSAAEPETVPVTEIARACYRLAERFEDWKQSCSEAEFQEMRQAMGQLQQKFMPEIDLTSSLQADNQM